MHQLTILLLSLLPLAHPLPNPIPAPEPGIPQPPPLADFASALNNWRGAVGLSIVTFTPSTTPPISTRSSATLGSQVPAVTVTITTRLPTTTGSSSRSTTTTRPTAAAMDAEAILTPEEEEEEARRQALEYQLGIGLGDGLGPGEAAQAFQFLPLEAKTTGKTTKKSSSTSSKKTTTSKPKETGEAMAMGIQGGDMEPTSTSTMVVHTTVFVTVTEAPKPSTRRK